MYYTQSLSISIYDKENHWIFLYPAMSQLVNAFVHPIPHHFLRGCLQASLESKAYVEFSLPAYVSPLNAHIIIAFSLLQTCASLA